MRARSLLPMCLLVAACAQGGAKSATSGGDDLTPRFVSAFEEEAKGNPETARGLYLDVADRAAQTLDNPWQKAALEAALDALVLRSIPEFSDVTESSALAYRTADATALAGDGSIPKSLPKDSIGARLASSYDSAEGPFARGLIARAMLDLAEHRGDVADAARWRERVGCAREAMIVGPLDWAPVTGVLRPDPLETFDAPLAASYPARGTLVPDARTTLARGHGCELDLTAPNPMTGVRDVVIDAEMPRAGKIGVALRARGEATLRVGGRIVLSRPYELGGGDVARFAVVDAERGKLRIVARVGMDADGGTAEIDAWDDHGAPLALHAPRIGDRGSARVTSASPWMSPPPKSDSEKLIAAAGALAEGDGRTAEHMLEDLPPGAPAGLWLAYARAVETAQDLSLVDRSERARSAYERVLELWPSSWEAIIAHAVLAGVRRGESDARIEVLRDLDTRRTALGVAGAIPILDAFEAMTSAKERLYDRAHGAFSRATPALEKTSLLIDVGRLASERVGAERSAYACSPVPPHDRSTLQCYSALRDAGDLSGSERELERLRAVRGGEDLFLSLTLRDALVRSDAERASGTLGRMTPGESSLSDIYATLDLAQKSGVDRTSRLHDAVTIARDAPNAWPLLLRALGDDPTIPFQGIAERLSAENRDRKGGDSEAATAVLVHTERYDIDKIGLVHALLFDVRRVGGTTDVEENAQAEPPDLIGRSTMRVLRRRILKRDGRIVEPDPTPRASQGHADLSQLEAGDLVEAIYEGWAVPGETGNVGIDTPDLLPERTSVHEGIVELHFPKDLSAHFWSHPLLGKAAQSVDGDQKVVTFRLKDAPVRRIEEGTPKMDRSVGFSFGTSDWKTMGQGLSEALASLDDHDPEVTAWAEKAAAGAKGTRDQIDAVVLASGSAVKEASASALTDVAFGRAEGPQSVTARTILGTREGSRTWLIVRALRELGIVADVVVAENDPFSAYESFPPHAGRFLHPLAVAHVAVPHGSDELVFIDADIPGPPLPAGRISPELRGRSALHADGSISPLPVTASGAGENEVDLRLWVQPNGDAKGTFTIVLRGHEAQELAEMLLRFVGDDRQKALRGVVLGWVPFADVDAVVLSSSEGSWQVAIRAELSILGYAEPERAAKSQGAQPESWLLPGIDPLHNVYPRPYSGTLGATYAAQGKRESALAVSHAVLYHAHRRVELPPGAQITKLPGPLEIKTAHLDASRKLTVAGSAIEDDFTLGLPTGTVAPGEYEAFVTDLHRTDDGFLAGTHVRLGGKR